MMKRTHAVQLLLAVLLVALPLSASGCGKKGSAESSMPRESSVAQSSMPYESFVAESVAPHESSSVKSTVPLISSSAKSTAPRVSSSAAESTAPRVSSSNKNQGLRKAPDFTLKNRADKEISLSDYTGKIVVLNFWASWCGPCRAEMAEFEKLHKKYSKTGDVKILMINQTFGQETRASADSYLNREKFTFEVLYDTGKVGYQTYGVNSYPTTMVVNADGYVTGGKMGTATLNEVEALIEGAR